MNLSKGNFRETRGICGDKGEVSERERAFGGKQILLLHKISHSEAWVSLASITIFEFMGLSVLSS